MPRASFPCHRMLAHSIPRWWRAGEASQHDLDLAISRRYVSCDRRASRNPPWNAPELRRPIDADVEPDGAVFPVRSQRGKTARAVALH
jgi:hypothetical protein